MKFILLAPALCALAAAAPINVEAPANVRIKDTIGAVNTATGTTNDMTASHINGGLRPAKDLVNNGVKRDEPAVQDLVDNVANVETGTVPLKRDIVGGNVINDNGVDLEASADLSSPSDKRVLVDEETISPDAIISNAPVDVDSEDIQVLRDAPVTADVDLKGDSVTGNVETREVEVPVDTVTDVKDKAPVDTDAGVNADADVDAEQKRQYDPEVALNAEVDPDAELEERYVNLNTAVDVSAPAVNGNDVATQLDA